MKSNIVTRESIEYSNVPDNGAPCWYLAETLKTLFERDSTKLEFMTTETIDVFRKSIERKKQLITFKKRAFFLESLRNKTNWNFVNSKHQGKMGATEILQIGFMTFCALFFKQWIHFSNSSCNARNYVSNKRSNFYQKELRFWFDRFPFCSFQNRSIYSKWADIITVSKASF